jgi:hypothetical protein
MEQGLSFLVLIVLLMISLFVIESSVMFLVVFLVGGTYLGMRGRNKNWNWKNRN